MEYNDSEILKRHPIISILVSILLIFSLVFFLGRGTGTYFIIEIGISFFGILILLYLLQLKWIASYIERIGTLLLVIELILIVLYLYRYDWTGFGSQVRLPFVEQSKTLWDWFQLLIVPAILGFGSLFINNTIQKTERLQAEGQLQEQRWQTYVDRMSGFLLDRSLADPVKGSDEVRTLARTLTLTTLSSLDGTHKIRLIKFLYESRLIGHIDGGVEISMSGADLKELQLKGGYLVKVNLAGADLSKSDFSDAQLMHTNLLKANFSGAILTKAHLDSSLMMGTNLEGAVLIETILDNAHLNGARFNDADLRKASFKGAILDLAHLTDAKLQGADLSGAVLKGAKINKLQLKEVIMDENTILPDGSRYKL